MLIIINKIYDGDAKTLHHLQELLLVLLPVDSCLVWFEIEFWDVSQKCYESLYLDLSTTRSDNNLTTNQFTVYVNVTGMWHVMIWYASVLTATIRTVIYLGPSFEMTTMY